MSAEVVKGMVTVRKTTPCARCSVNIICSPTQGAQAYSVTKCGKTIKPLCSTTCRDKEAENLADED